MEFTMTMQKRHFELIARTLKNLRDEPAVDQATLDMVVREFGRSLRATNPNFDISRFEEATK